LAGCGGASGTVQVTGKLVKAGAPYTPPADQRVGVTLYAMGASSSPISPGEPFPAVVNPADGTFAVPGPDGYGIPPGKYRIAIIQNWKREAILNKKTAGREVFNRDTDILGERYSPLYSPIVRDLTSSGDLTLEIDDSAPEKKPRKPPLIGD
jgi:hypothetical protein